MAEAQTAIILVTDLVGSTAQRSEIGEEAAEDLRRRHDAALTNAVTEHEGIVVKSLGDGVLARFAGAASAVASAVAMQQCTEGEFDIRVGISAGDVTLENGDCFGTPVIEASRLCDRADGGQILVAELARLLARGRGGHTFEPAGELDLKGLPDPVVASQVVWERIEADRIRFPAALRIEGMPFSGRVGALDELTLVWKAVAASDRRVVLLSGEPGMGKTRLAAELARIAHDDGGTVLFGRSDDEVTSAHRPFTEALGALAADLPDEALAAHVERFDGALAGIVPALSTRMPGLRAPEGGSDELRLVVYDAVADLLRRASALAPVLLVLDDLHWADDGSVLLLRHLAQTRDLGSVLVVGTYRDTDLVRSHRLSSALADLRRVEGVERVALEGLDLDEVVDLMAAAGGHDLDERGIELARLVHRETEGNPFFIGEILRHFAESGAIYESDGRWVSDATSVADIGVPQGIREVVGRRLDALPEATNATLRAASVIGQEFDLRVLAAALGRDIDDVIDDLDPALDRNIVVELPGGVDQLRFPHALVRQTLSEELSTSRRVRLHAKIARGWGELGEGYITERAHHLLEAASVADLADVVHAAIAASETALRAVASETSIDWLDRAAEVVADDGGERHDLEVDLMVARAEVLVGAGEYAASYDVALRGAELARERGLREQLAEAAIWVGLLGAWVEIDATEGLALIEAAEAGLDEGESRLRAELLVARAHLSIHSPDPEVSITPALEGLAMAKRTGSTRLGPALVTAADVLRGEPDPDLIEQIATEIRAVDSPTDRVRGFYFEALAHMKRGDFDRVEMLTESLFDEATRIRTRHNLLHALLMRMNLHLHRARWDDAWATLAEVEEIDEVIGQTGLAQRGIQRGTIGSLSGDLELTRNGFRMMVDAAPQWGLLVPVEGIIAEMAGGASSAELTPMADAYCQVLPFLPHWIATTATGTSAALLRFASPEQLPGLVETTEAHRGLWLTSAAEVHSGHCSGALGLYAIGRGDDDSAVDLLSDAIAAHDAAGEIPRRARMAMYLVEVLARRNRPGDRDRASRLADEVAESCERHRIDLLADRVAAALS